MYVDASRRRVTNHETQTPNPPAATPPVGTNTNTQESREGQGDGGWSWGKVWYHRSVKRSIEFRAGLVEKLVERGALERRTVNWLVNEAVEIFLGGVMPLSPSTAQPLCRPVVEAGRLSPKEKAARDLARVRKPGECKCDGGPYFHCSRCKTGRYAGV